MQFDMSTFTAANVAAMTTKAYHAYGKIIVVRRDVRHEQVQGGQRVRSTDTAFESDGGVRGDATTRSRRGLRRRRRGVR